jgi:hypothetical protein
VHRCDTLTDERTIISSGLNTVILVHTHSLTNVTNDFSGLDTVLLGIGLSLSGATMYRCDGGIFLSYNVQAQ